MLFMPIFNGMADLILSLFDTFKSYLAVIIACNNKKVQDAGEPSTQRRIGFILEAEDEEGEDEDDL